MNRKVLMFAYDYPPMGWSGVQRTVKFVRYMPNNGWDPVVVVPKDRYSPVPLDVSFLEEVGHVETIRTDIFTAKDLDRLGHKVWRGLRSVLSLFGKNEQWLVDGLKWRIESLFFPDQGVTWVPYAVKQGLNAVREYKPEVIYATAPPYSTLISAWMVAKISKIPLVVDLRDLWTDAPLRIMKSHFKKRMDIYLEGIVLSGSSAIITTTQSGVKLLTERYLKKQGMIFTLYNGYDENEFFISGPNETASETKNKLVISHVGSLYGDITPAPFINGLVRCLEQKPFGTLPLLIRFVGEVSQFMNVFRAFEHLNMIELIGVVDHPEAITIMKNSDVLLLIVAEKHKKVIPGKVFEYFASRRPILCIAPLDGEIAELICQTENFWLADVGDTEGIAQCLSEIFQKWHSGEGLERTKMEHVRKFERKSLTANLCKILDQVTGRVDAFKGKQ